MRRVQPGGTLETIRARWRALVGGLLAVLGLVVLALLLVPRLPCEFPGGDACAPPDETAEVIPADALAYVHANLGSDTEQYERAAEVADALPRFSGELTDRLVRALGDGRGRADEFEAEIRPWFGGEIAFALLDAEEEVVILEVAEGEGEQAEEFAASLRKSERDGPRAETVEHEGVEITTDRAGLATARVDGFLVVGPPDGLRAVIDTARSADGAGSLADEEAAASLRDELPEAFLLDAYLSGEGVDSLLPGASGPLGALAAARPGGAVAASLGVGEADDLEVALRAELEEVEGEGEQAKGLTGLLSAFEPTLPERLSSATLGYLGLGDPGKALAAVLERFPGLRKRVGLGDGEPKAELSRVLGDEAALTLQRPPGAADPEAATPVPAPEALPGPGIATAGGDSEELASVLGALGVSRVELLAEGTDGLGSSERFEAATEDLPEEVSLLGFLDLDRLVTLGEGLGLAEDPVYAVFAGEFRRLDAIGLSVAGDADVLAADARLLIGEPREPVGPAPPVAPSD